MELAVILLLQQKAVTVPAVPAAPTLGGVVVIFITAALGYIGGYITSRAQAKLEYDKWLRARKDDVRRDIRSAVAQLASDLAALAHVVLWFSYKVVNSGASPDKAQLTAYNEESHRLLSAVVGTQVRLAAFDDRAYKKMTPFVSKIIKLSEDLDEALALLRSDVKNGNAAVLTCNEAALSYIKQLPGHIADTIGYDGDFCEFQPGS